ncbi:hypothetical protein ACOMHN_006397 [Nucella lapillus]
MVMKFVEEVDRRRQGVEDLRNKASELVPRLSQHDTELVHEHMRTTERRYGELQASAEKKQRSYGSLGDDLGHIRTEAEQYIRWLDDTNSILCTQLRLGVDPDEVNQHLQATQELSMTLEEKQLTVEAVRHQAEALLEDLPGPERQSVDLLVRQVQAQHTQVMELVTMRCAKLEESRQLRLDFKTSVSKQQDWMDGRVKAAEKLDTVRLLASNVEKQANKCKSLAAKVESHSSQLEELDSRGQQLKEGCTEEGAEQVDTTMTELKDQQQTLSDRLKRQEDHLKTCAATRRVFEADCHKIEQWCRETDVSCGADLPSDCATEVLEQQLQHYKSLASTADMFESLVRETVEKGGGFKADLYDNDLLVLEEQLASLQASFDSTSKAVRERLHSVESSLACRQEVQERIESCRSWLDSMQDRVSTAHCPIGPDPQHAQAELDQFEMLEKSLAEYQPTMAQLSSNVETLRAQGQISQAEDILRLTSQHELLIDRVSGGRSKRQTALGVREQHQGQLGEIVEVLRDSRAQMESVADLGVSVPDRLQKYQEIQENLSKLDPKISLAEDQARQISLDCSQEDQTRVLDQVESAKQDLSQLRQQLKTHKEQCRQIQHDRQSFEVVVGEIVAWLEDKEDVLASLRPLHLDSDKVDPVIEKHKALSSEAVHKLNSIKGKAEIELSHFQELGEPVPEPFTGKVQQITLLQTSIQEAIEKKQQYLTEAKADREQLETSMRQVNDWLRGAEQLLDSGYEGMDYNSAENTLSEFTDYFSEASLCQDEIDQVSELSDKLLTTLDSNDTETLRQSLASVNRRLAHALASGQNKQQLLEGKTAQWQSFQEGSQTMSQCLDELETDWQQVDRGTLSSPEELTALLDTVRTFTARLEEKQESIGSLNETARSLIRSANPASSATINRLMLTINQRWEDMVSKVDGRQSSLEELQSQWQEFSSSLHGAEDVVRNTQQTMDSIHSLPDTETQLVEQLDMLRTVNDELYSVGPQVDRLRASSSVLQKTLPSAEALVTLQDRFITLSENYDRLKTSVSDELVQMQEEAEDRHNFHTEVTQTLSWLADAHTALATMDPEAHDAQDNVDRCKTYQQEITLRMGQMRRLTVLQETKYAALSRDLPQEMREQLLEMHDLEKQVSTALREKREELIHLREDREEYRMTLVKVSDWLQRAEEQLQQRTVDIPQARMAHQELLSQFDEFKQSLDYLRAKGADLLRHSGDPGEKQEVQQTIAAVNRQWLSLQAGTADRTQELSEAADLAHAVEDVAQSVDTWLAQAQGVVEAELDWTDFDNVREQLKTHKQLVKELEQNEDKLVALNAMVKQLDQVCETSHSMAAVGALRTHLQQVGGQGQGRLGLLQDASQKMEDYHKELQGLRLWMEDTQTRISMRDTTRDLKEQLAVQERLLEDIQSNKARTEEVVLQHAAIHDTSGESTPSQGHRLLQEIGDLQEAAQAQCSELRAAVTEQEKYETEIRHLNAAVSEAQQKLLASPVRASTVEALKQQIAEHNEPETVTCFGVCYVQLFVANFITSGWASPASACCMRPHPSSSFQTLASQIKAYQATISQINKKSQQLSLRVAQASTITSRKRYLTDMVYRNWLSASKSDTGIDAHSSPVSSASFTLDNTSFDSGLDTGANLSQSMQTSPSQSATLHSYSPLTARPAAFSVTPRSEHSATDSGRFKPILDSSRVDSSASFRSDESDSFASQPGDLSVKSIGWSAQSGPVDSYKVKSASDPRLHGSSFFKKSLGQGPDSDVGKQDLMDEREGSRARSSSFGQDVEPLGHPFGSVPRIEELNQSWNTLQNQVSAKEKELQLALQRQERYQQAVQEVTAKMERAHISLARTPASVAADMDSQMRDYKDSLAELESIKEDMVVVGERGRQMMEVSDAEGSKAMEATLTMLNDRLTSLQGLADHKGKHLQDAQKQKNKHDVTLSAYKKRVSDLESWLGEMKVRHATTPLPTDQPAEIQRQLQENRDLQEELNHKLQQISDLAVQCDSLCELETPSEADKLRKQLSGLHSRLGDFKLLTIDRQTSLRRALSDSEKRQKEMDDYESRVSKLQQWMTDTKQLTLPSESSHTLPDHSQLHQDLASDLSDHQRLVQQLSVTAPSTRSSGADRGAHPSSTETMMRVAPNVSEAQLHSGWEALQRDLARKTKQLESVLQRRKSGETVGPLSSSVGDTSRQLADVQALVAQLAKCWQQLQVQVDDKQLRLDTALSFQQQMQSALGAMSAWLDSAESIVLGPPSSTQSQHDRLRQNEALQRDLRSLQSKISTLSGQTQDLLPRSSGESHGLIQESLTNLTQRVAMLEQQAVSRSEQLRHMQHQWQQYHDDVRALRSRMQELQTSVMGPTTPSTATLDSLVSNITKLETQLKKCEGQLDELKGRERELSSHTPRAVVPSELGSLRNTYMDLQRKVGERKASLLQSVSVQEQYEKMLKDYADFLETAEGKLKTEAISARDLPHLKQQLSAHKEFFSDLEVHKAMLDSLCGQCDPATQEAHSLQHTRLSNLTHVLADQASLHGQRLERLVRQWSDLSDKLGHLCQFHAQVEEGIPKPIASGDSLATIQDKLTKFKRLQGQLSDERPTVFQAVDQGKQILHSVGCPALETAVTDLADKWVALNTTLVQQLKKTETIGEQLQIFEAEAMVLKTWMATAKMKLDDLKHLSEEDLQNIGNIRTKVEHLLEFRKEVQNQLPLKSKVMSVGKQLMANRNYDTRGLDGRLRTLEEGWGQLEQCVNLAELSLHQAQMELMPSRQALHELQLWMEEIEKALKGDANTPIKTLDDIEVLLKKYKGYKVELASKQLTMDFVNQAVLQPGPNETDVPHEKLDYADKLNQLNQHWTKVSNDINDRLRSLEQLSGKWADYEAALAQLQSWFRQQEDKIKRYRLIGHEVGVKQTLKDCKSMQEQLQARREDMNSVKVLGQTLIDLSRESPGCQRSVRESLSSLTQQWEQLQQQTMQLEGLLTDMLGQWARYHADLHSLTQVLAQTEYTLNRYSSVGADMSTLINQVDKLKSLERELKQHSSHLDSFSSLAAQLCQQCEAPVQSDVQATLSNIKTKWSKLSADLSTRRAQFERCLNKWHEYEAEYEKISDWLSKKEAECNEFIGMREDVMARQECLEKSEALQQDLDEIQSQLSALYRLSDELTKNMGTSTIVLLTSRQSALEQRLVALRQLLSQHIRALHDDLSQVNRFREAFAAVRKFLEHAGSILSIEDPNRTAEQPELQNRLDRLKDLSAQFQANSSKLDEVNDLGYRLALDASDARQLLELNHDWHRMAADCQDRSKALQGHVLVQQDFTTKCQTWMAFLATTERDLATEIAGILTDLLEQQRKCQKFEGEMYSHQQVLHAIVSDGQKMMRAGEVEDPAGFEQKLRLLSEQWQSVIGRAGQRKGIIDDMIQDWHLFNSLSDQLRTWLQEKREGLKVFDVDKLSLQQIRNLLDRVKMIQSEFKLQEESFRKVHDLGATLLQRADPSAAQQIKVVTAQVQHAWLEVYNKLEEQRVRLEALQADWRQCEDDIEEILAWLKNIRQKLNSDIPNTYDDLQTDLTRCKDIAASFDNSEDKRQRLQAREKKLSRVIQAEDMNVLHQRIRLLNKQWEELKSQAGLRDHRLRDSTFRWSNLGEQIRALIEWIDDMEAHIVSSREIHIEDLLNKLETEYADAMEMKEREVDEVLSRGQTLVQNSSEVRASDIQQRLQRLQDKWADLQAVVEFRKRKLKETVLAVKQLESSMRNLSQWLAMMEQELNAPVIYHDCDMQDIHAKLQHAQDIQRDIEQHSAGVSSVLNLCEVLLHDTDACPTHTEFEALQHAMKNLDRRWKTIFGMCPERRARIKETWDLWETFSTDCRRFSDWLSNMEVETGNAEASIPPSGTKEDIRNYENLQRKVHDHLSDLESINKQYRHLAKERRSDNKGVLRSRMQEANDRWDALQQRVTALMQGLRHSASIREDFIATRLSLMQWLTEVDMQLTNIEHLSQMDVPTKIREIQRIEEEVDDRRHRMDYLQQAAVLLIQQGSEEDALRVQQELDEFKQFSRQVLGRVDTCRAALQRVAAAQVEDIGKLEETERYAEREASTDDLTGGRPPGTEWDTRELEAYLESSPPDSPPYKRRAGAGGTVLPRASVSPMRCSVPPLRSTSPLLRSASPLRSSSPTRSGSPSRRSVSPTRRSLSPTRQSLSPTRRSLSPTRRSVSPSRWSKDEADGEGERWARGRSAKIDVLVEQLADALEAASAHLDLVERQMGARTSSDTAPSHREVQSVMECEKQVDTVQCLDRLLKIEAGSAIIPSVDTQVKGVTDRWERVQSRATERNVRISQQQRDLSKFMGDVDSLLMWLDEAEALQASHSTMPSDITQLNLVIRQHKDFMIQLEGKRARFLSIQLLSKNYINTKIPEGRQLQMRVEEVERRWNMVTARAADTQHTLQGALLHCQEFHHTVQDYLLWLEGLETRIRRCEPVRLSAEASLLTDTYNILQDLRSELESNQPAVLSLRETADQLLVSGDLPEMSAARDKTHVISSRLNSLLHLTNAYLQSLEARLTAKSGTDTREGRLPTVIHPTLRTRTRSPFALLRKLLFGEPVISLPADQPHSANSTTDPESLESISAVCQRHPGRQGLLLHRVLRTALPLQLLLLLLLGVACLVPVCEEDVDCLLVNNLRRSLSPLLRFLDGAPPT